MHSSLSMLTLPVKALLVKLQHQNAENGTAALRSYRCRKGIPIGKCPKTSSVVKRMISKFEDTGCLNDMPCLGQPSINANAARTVQENMAIVVISFTHGEVSTRKVEHLTGIHECLGSTTECFPTLSVQNSCHHEQLLGDFVKRKEFALWKFQIMVEDNDRLSNVLWANVAHFTFRESVRSHNSRIWETGNPNTFALTPLHDEKVSVWCYLPHLQVLVPFSSRKCVFLILELSMTDEKYADMLQNTYHP